MQIENKTVVVTGANRGIGRALVVEFLGRGVKRIYATARKLESLPDFHDPRVVPVQLDITDPANVQAAAKAASDASILVNNAGVAAFTSLLGKEPALFERDMRTNYYGTLDMMRAFIPVLEGKREAAIVNVVTMAAFVNLPVLGAYSASKAALFSASQGIRIELAPRGISVHTVNPGPIDTEMARPLAMEKTSPEATATSIVDGLVAGDADIFPDPGARQMFEVWKGGYRQLEKLVHDMHHGAG